MGVESDRVAEVEGRNMGGAVARIDEVEVEMEIGDG